MSFLRAMPSALPRLAPSWVWRWPLLATILLTLFSVFSASAQVLTTLANFDGSQNGGLPVGILVQGHDGNFYGVTWIGATGAYGGEVFKVTPAGTLTVVALFTPRITSAYSGLVLGIDGNFYGQTDRGGGAGGCFDKCGTVFRVTGSGQLTLLKSLNGRTGKFPLSPLALAPDGSFYGPTEAGGSGCGTVFNITNSGQGTVVISFNHANGCVGGSLVAGTNGNMYGVTKNGGIESANCTGGRPGCGTIFMLTQQGQATTLYKFDGSSGWSPSAALVQGGDGDFYGVTEAANMGNGTIFRMTPSGALTFLHLFDGSDGSIPSGLTQGTDGNFYGTTLIGGTGSCTYGCGTIFRMTPQGQLTTLINFDGVGGGYHPSGLVQDTDGGFYGLTYYGGLNDYGTIYRLDVGLGPFVITSPRFGVIGSQVNILGTNLIGTTAVSFNGTPATFTVVSATLITATVPSGATSGQVTVTTPSSVLKSNTNFVVLP